MTVPVPGRAGPAKHPSRVPRDVRVYQVLTACSVLGTWAAVGMGSAFVWVYGLPTALFERPSPVIPVTVADPLAPMPYKRAPLSAAMVLQSKEPIVAFAADEKEIVWATGCVRDTSKDARWPVSSPGLLMRAPAGGGAPRQLAKVADACPLAVALTPNRVHWTVDQSGATRSDGVLYSVPRSTPGAPAMNAANIGRSPNLEVAGSTLIFANSLYGAYKDSILQLPVQGAAPLTTLAKSGSPDGLVVRGNEAFWLRLSGPYGAGVDTVNLGNKQSRRVYACGHDFPAMDSVAANERALFVMVRHRDKPRYQVIRVEREAGREDVLFQGAGIAPESRRRRMVVEGDRLYWVAREGDERDSLLSIGTTGGEATEIASGARIKDLIVVGRDLYFSSEHEVFRAALHGEASQGGWPAVNAPPTAWPDPPSPVAGAARPDGFATDIPPGQSHPPTSAEWSAATGVKVSPSGCWWKAVREWLRMNCSRDRDKGNDPGPVAIEGVGEFGVVNHDYFVQLTEQAFSDVIVRMVRGRRSVASLQLRDHTIRMGYDWSGSGAFPLVVWEGP